MNKIKPKSEEHRPPQESVGCELAERRKGKTRTGTVVYWAYTGSTIRNMKTGDSWPGFRFRMEGKRGAQWWSATYADKTKPIAKSLEDLREALIAINCSKAHAASWTGQLGPYILTVDQLIAKTRAEATA